MTELSVEAKVVGGAFFGSPCPLPTTELSFDRPWIIHPKTRKGLDDLVAAGMLTVEKWNKYSDKLIWRPTGRMKTDLPNINLKFIKDNTFPVTTE